MKTSAKPSKTDKSEKGGKCLPAFCSFLGTLIILLVICIALMFALPGLFGYEIYTVVSGSMEPALSPGSAVLVKYADPEKIELGEIVAFMDGSEPVTHRVIENHMVERELVTKGDANEIADFDPVPYGSVIGNVRYSVPLLGYYLTALTSLAGKAYLICFAACGLLLNLIASVLRDNRRYQEKAGHGPARKDGKQRKT